MARFIKKVSSDGTSSGGGAGVSLAEVCTAVCNVICANATCQVPNRITATSGNDATTHTPQIIPGYSCWQMICNCPCWTDCYGCDIIWCVDTSKYRAFRIRYNGIRNCKCCYTYMCWHWGDSSCFCCCSSNNNVRGMCVAEWPMTCDCHCYSQWCNFSCGTASGCIYCCGMASDAIWWFEYTICGTDYYKCTSQNRGNTILVDICYAKCRNNCDRYQWAGHTRMKARNHSCDCLMWNCTQNSSHYLSRICLRVSNTPFMSAIAGGSYQSQNGGVNSAGQPCWTIWGMPCFRPKFGATEEGLSGASFSTFGV